MASKFVGQHQNFYICSLRATLNECAQLAKVLSLYERALGQKINYQKIEVSFSKNVNVVVRAAVLGVKEVDRDGKYLGLPTVIGRSKKVVFSIIKDRIWKRLQGWRGNLLSKAGKEVLIKSLLQSIPTYIMSIFRLPNNLISEINSMIARFWWGSTELHRSIHWKRWSFMCLPKKLGGMGFRDLSSFNNSLLAKQGWRLMMSQNSLCFRVLKARYFPRSDFLSAATGYNSSYSWTSICSTQSLLRKGIGWCIDDGASEPLDSQWIPEGMRLRGPSPHIGTDFHSFVSDYITIDRRWDIQAVARDFCSADVQCILGIPISVRQCSDSRCWWPNRDGIYTVRPGYWLSTCESVEQWQERLAGQINDLWRSVWRMKAPPKLKNFALRVNSESLPVKSNLFRRRVVDSAVCDRCLLDDESIWHVLVSCPEVDVAWVGAESLLHWCCQLHFLNLQQALTDVVEVKGTQGFFLLIQHSWVAWTCRNKVIFEPEFTNLEVIRVGLEKMVSDYLQHQQSQSVLNHGGVAAQISADVGWCPPTGGFLKLNVDAGIFGNEIGMVVVCRDGGGKVLMVASHRCFKVSDILVAEALACRWGLILAIRLDYNIIMESDYKQLDIISQKQSCKYALFSLIRRTSNVVAHHAARLNSLVDQEVVIFLDFPQNEMEEVTAKLVQESLQIEPS
ncbi:LOW QUALITY PROTEIN: hypothetical protein V2J09_000578 [Rumex salicifolius]